ncbi:hypothetical protein ACROYT_G024596 [Oculina patagonica]
MAAHMIHLTLQCIAICFLSKFVISVKECKKIDQCRCSTDEGEISLKKLAGTGGKPRFPRIPDSKAKAFTFSWNPCDSYSLPSGCADVAACFEQTVLKEVKYWSVAKQDAADCVLTENGQCVLIYTGTALTRESVFSVALQCNKTVEGHIDPVVSDILKDTYKTVLHSKYACPSSSSGSSTGLSTGSILVIIFSCLVIAYIVCGILVNKYARELEGKEVFPNYSFWADVPYLIKDGCVFTLHSLGSLCGKGPSRTGYASI